MPNTKIQLGNSEVEVDTSIAVLFNNELDKAKTEAVTSYKTDMAGKKYKFGEEEKMYEDMDALYKDAMKYYKDMCKYRDQLKDMSMKKDSADSKLQVLEDRLSKVKETPKHNPEEIRQRVALQKNAVLFCDGLTEEQAYDLSDRELKERIINLENLSEKSDQSIKDMYEVAIKYATDSKFEKQKQQTYKADSVPDASLKADEIAYAKKIADLENSWK